jgi:hypothetical protein
LRQDIKLHLEIYFQSDKDIECLAAIIKLSIIMQVFVITCLGVEMSQFDKDRVEIFLGAVRKYMQVRGPMSQKDLAEVTDTGVSTMSRFLNQQTVELNANLIANITAKLSIPLHEIIDFVEESYTDQFIRLVKFYKGDDADKEVEKTVKSDAPDMNQGNEEDEEIAKALDSGGSEKTFKSSISVGGKKSNLVFQKEGSSDGLRGKLEKLSLKQKGFLNEFLSLDSDGKDLVADVGRNIITYLKQKGIDF